MFYKQSMNDIKVVVLTLDGGLLDVNRLRYNYFNRLCQSYNQNISREEYTNSLGNMKTMYNTSPIEKYIPSFKLNELIEKNLFAYAKLKPNIQKDGAEELLQFFVQREIKVVVVSTHKTKRAIQYLQLTRLYKYVDYVIGGDSKDKPLPDSSLLQTICNQMCVSHESVLVVANFPSLLAAANRSLMNVVYMADLVSPDARVMASVYKVARNNLEIINLFLFAKYDTLEMYSPLLGMSGDMDTTTLKKTYQELLIEYSNDLKLTQLVHQTYRYFLTEINDKKTRADITQYQDEDEIRNLIIPKVKTRQDDVFSFETITKVSLDIVEDVNNETLEIPDFFKQQANDLNRLMDQINAQSTDTVEDIVVDTVENIEELDEFIDVSDTAPIENEKATPSKIGTVLMDILYTFMLSAIVAFIAIVIYIALEDFINASGVISSILRSVLDFYADTVVVTFSFVFNGLHSILSFVPDYNGLISDGSIISGTGKEILLYVVFNVGFMYMVKGIQSLERKEVAVDESW